MGDFRSTWILLYAPLTLALKNGRAKYGCTRFSFSDDDVERVPVELRRELSVWIEAAAQADDETDPVSYALVVEKPDATIENIIAALRREANARRQRAIDEWIWKPEKDWFGALGEPVPAVAALQDDLLVATRLKAYEQERAARRKSAEAADEGLRAYALALPELARAAREKYDVRVSALDHYVKTIASFDEDAMVLRVGTPEYDNAKLEERRAPNAYAFSVLDNVTAHIEQLPKPDGVMTTIGRVQRFRRAVMKEHRGAKKWGLDEPVTIAIVTITAYVAADRVIVFFADEEDRQRVKRAEQEAALLDTEIPF